MPFDGKPTAAQNLDTLIQALRSPMPKGFAWSFCSYRNCGVGLALHLGIVERRDYPHWSYTEKPLGLTADQAKAAFGDASYDPIANLDITPQMVADRLEAMKDSNR